MTQPLPKTYQDARWLDDLDPTGAETASDLESLEQDVLHIISENLASNPADPNSGIGAVNYLSGTSLQLAQMAPIIDAQLAGVSRVTSSSTKISQQADGSWLILVTIAVNGNVVNFTYVLGPNGLLRQ